MPVQLVDVNKCEFDCDIDDDYGELNGNTDNCDKDSHEGFLANDN